MSDNKDDMDKDLSGKVGKTPGVSVGEPVTPTVTVEESGQPKETVQDPNKPIKLTTTSVPQPGQQPMKFGTKAAVPEAEEEKTPSKEVKTKPEMAKVGYQSLMDFVSGREWEEWFKAFFTNIGHMIKAGRDYLKYRNEMKEFNKTGAEDASQVPPTLGGNTATPPTLGGGTGVTPGPTNPTLGDAAGKVSHAAQQHATSGGTVPPSPGQADKTEPVTPKANSEAAEAKHADEADRQARTADKEKKAGAEQPPPKSTSPHP